MTRTSRENSALHQRYDDAILRAQEWLQTEGRSQSWLAREIGVDRSVLSRFLSRDAEVYSPGPNRPRIMKILEGVERICTPRARDLFLSHRSVDKDFVRRLASDIESHQYGSNRLLTWVDEAEIRPGQSIPAMINRGLETSRFVALVMTPSYFQSDSGWADAEWHAALHIDPDNRGARLLPLLVEDCPYVPALLRHLLMIDFRESRYEKSLEHLLRVLRNEPLPRPVTYRGQLIESTGRIDRATLFAERAVPDADPDVASEKLYSNLLPIERLPQYIYIGRIASSLSKEKPDGHSALPTKGKLIEMVRNVQTQNGIEQPFTPAFRTIEDSVVTFHDLEDPDSVLTPIIEPESVDVVPTNQYIVEEDHRNILISLLNMALRRHLNGRGLVIDDTRDDRFYFPPKDGKPHVVRWRPLRKASTRTVTKPYERNGKRLGWMHQAAYIRAVYLGGHIYVKIVPTRVLTEDGNHAKGGPDIGRVIIRWLGQERNIHVLYHVRFWTMMLRRSPGPTINVRAGDQFMEIRPVPAFVQQAYGYRDDRMNLLDLLDDEAQPIAEAEDQDDAIEIETDTVEEDLDLVEGEIEEVTEENESGERID